MTKMAAKSPAVRQKQYQMMVEEELHRAESRIRAVDVFGACLVLVVGLLAYVGTLMVLDYFVHVPRAIRIGLFVMLAGAGAVYAAWALVRPLLRSINPYFAARTLEKANPDAKNGLINWLDLQGQPMSGAIRESLQRHAVNTLESVHVEEAIPSRRPMRLLFVSSIMVLVLIALYFSLPAQFASLFKRALLPFMDAAIPTHTRIELILPVADPVPPDPDTPEILVHEVAAGEPVPFAVRIHGLVPDDVFLEYQRTLEEHPLRRPFLRPQDADRREEWRLTLSSDLIPADGLFFRVMAGDGRTRQGRLVVVSRKPPTVSDVDITLTFPAYTGRRPQRQAFAPIRALVGTQVAFGVTADQPVVDGRLEVLALNNDQRLAITSTFKLVPAPDTHRVDQRRLVLDQPWEIADALRQQGRYRLVLNSADGKQGVSPEYPIEVEADSAPQVDIRQVGEQVLVPGQFQRIELAANDVVPVLGRVFDDVAVGSVRLVIRQKDSPGDLGFVDSKWFEEVNQRASGYAPAPVDFQLTLDLSKLMTVQRQEDKVEPVAPFVLRGGEVLELWVEATDACEPKPNVGRSQTIEIAIKTPIEPEERKQQEQKAQQEEQRADQQRRDRMERENRDMPQDPEQKPQQQEPGQGQPEQKPDQQPGQGQDQKQDPKAGQGQPEQKPDQQPGQGQDQKQDPKAGQGQPE
ncbi:MAG TPA: hypothetical protein PKC45_04805, partial [Gemmatales bacterium]|nr:hypothetical protein [Gemmatales bacterium]